MNRSVQWFASLVLLSAPLLAACASAAPVSNPNPTSEKRSVTGSVTYQAGSALPPNAVVAVQLVDVSLADAPARVLAEQNIEAQGKQPPFLFELLYETAAINPQHDYAVQARITADGQLLFINTQRYAVITKGNPTSNVEIVVEPVKSSTPAASPASASVTGDVIYFSRIALSPTALVEVTLADVSKADAPAEVISTQQIDRKGRQVPFPYELPYDPAKIDPKHDYAVSARITDGGKLIFANKQRYAVITKGNPTSKVQITVELVGGLAPAPSGSAVLTGTVTYLQRSTLPSTSLVEVTLADVSKADAPAEVVSQQKFVTNGRQVPIPYELNYDPAKIDPTHTYAVSARITDSSGKPLFINTTRYPVLTHGAPMTGVEIVLQPPP